MTTDRDETSVMTETQPNGWFNPEKALPRQKPDLLDPRVNPVTAFPDESVTCASPEFGGDVFDLNEK